MVINYKKINPNGFYLMKYLNDILIRFIILYGGSSSGKSYSVAQSILIQTLHDGENTLVMRKVGASIAKSIYEDYKVASKGLGIFHLFRFKINSIECLVNGARIDFSGLDDSEKIKGISNYKRVQLEELSEYEFGDWKQIRKRLRGKEGQQIIATFNPISEQHWIKKEVFDADTFTELPMLVQIGGQQIPPELTRVKSIRISSPKNIMNPRTGEIETKPGNMVIIQSTYLNNFWVVGSPCGTYGFYDEQTVADFEHDRLTDPDYYNIYALGEWGVLRTGSEFFGSFNIGIHTADCPWNPELPIHISVDNNVLPFISISVWQVDYSQGVRISQFAEVCAESPDNTVRKAARKFASHAFSSGWFANEAKVILHGDASTKAASTFDDEKRSWMDLFIDTLQQEGVVVEDKVGNRNPSVAMTGEFINAIFDGQVDGISILIGSGCRQSIDDYSSVQKDANGAILKTKVKNKVTNQSYEEHGHLSDTFRYIVFDVLREQYTAFVNARKRNIYGRDDSIRFFNPTGTFSYTQSLLYIMPNVNGKLVAVHGRNIGTEWHVTDIVYRESTSVEEVRDVVESHDGLCVMECADAYFPFVRELRGSIERDIRVMKEHADMDRRVSATSDYVKGMVRFDGGKTDDAMYGTFLTDVMNYNKDSVTKEAGIALSGFVQYALKL